MTWLITWKHGPDCKSAGHGTDTVVQDGRVAFLPSSNPPTSTTWPSVTELELEISNPPPTPVASAGTSLLYLRGLPRLKPLSEQPQHALTSVCGPREAKPRERSEHGGRLTGRGGLKASSIMVQWCTVVSLVGVKRYSIP